jgi:predicted nucleic acid-binding protein
MVVWGHGTWGQTLCPTSSLQTSQSPRATAVRTPEPGPGFSQIRARLIRVGDLRGNLISDAYPAALAIENGVGVCSFDSDFARFPEAPGHCPGHA